MRHGARLHRADESARARWLARRATRPLIDPARPYAPRPPHFPAKAKNVVVIFCAGAVSQLETWDYKPELIKWDGKPLPGGPAVTFQGPAGNLARPQYEFRPRGQTGKWVCDLIPHLAELTDDIAFIHSLTSKIEHARPGGELPLHRLRARWLSRASARG